MLQNENQGQSLVILW